MKILYIDIETAPILAHVWGLWNQNVGLNQVMGQPRILCFAAKWHGRKRSIFKSEWRHGHDEMIRAAWGLLDEADVVVHYNGERFDIPWLNTEFAVAGLTPPSPYKNVDLLRAVKRRFRFPSNKLAHVSSVFGVGEKMAHEGHDLWTKVLDGNREAQRTMKAYNEQDTLLLEELYGRLLPWIPGLPSVALYNGAAKDDMVCPACGSEDLAKNGFAYTPTSKFQRYRCRSCGAPVREGRRVSGVGLRQVSW